MDTLKLPGQLDGESLEEAVNRLLDSSNGKDPQLPHLSKDGVEALYTFGYGLYESGKYEKAMHFFRFLTLIDIGGRRHWMGLGASYQMLKQYERALQCYGQAALLDENDPWTHWHAAECFLSLKNYEQAKEALTSAEITASKYPHKYRALLDRLHLMKTGSPRKAEVKSPKKKASAKGQKKAKAKNKANKKVKTK